MSMEMHVQTRQSLRPDPEFDAIHAFFVVVSRQSSANTETQLECKNDTDAFATHIETMPFLKDILILDPNNVNEGGLEKRREFLTETGLSEVNVSYFISEHDLIHGLRNLITVSFHSFFGKAFRINPFAGA
jgi:hypothetical protein